MSGAELALLSVAAVLALLAVAAQMRANQPAVRWLLFISAVVLVVVAVLRASR
jgi:hypothetical protein